MRVTADMMVAQSVRRLSQRMASYERVQQQVATGKRFVKPSQQPADANTGLALRAAKRSREQEQRAAADAESWLNVVDAQMQSAVDRLHRLRDLSVAVNPSFTDAQRDGIAMEMTAIRDELVEIANARHRGRPLFGGFTDATPVTGGSGAWTLNDDGGQVLRRIGEQDVVRINVTASEAFTFAGGGDDVFTLVDDLAAAVTAGGGAAIGPQIDRIDAALGALASQQARIGATANHLESARARNLQVDLAIRAELAATEDVDVAEAVMELQVQQVGFEATLRAVGMALPPSLVSFL